MKPIVFKEQLTFVVNQLDEEVSLSTVKIDFKHLLGCGLYGQVYPLVNRPINERSWFMKHFTLVYDLSHRPKAGEEQTDYCIKIFKPIPYVLAKIAYFTARNYLSNPYQLAVDSFSTKNQEYNSHKLLERYRLTSMKFYAGGGWWGQIKTKITGKTLEDYCATKEFLAKDSFQLRVQLYHFFLNISMSPLTYFDVHARNLMFSEQNHQWLIVDGTVQEPEGIYINQKEKNKQIRSVALELSKRLEPVEKRLILALANSTESQK